MQIGTNRPSLNLSHLFSLFSLKLDTVCVSAGIELFTLTASTVEDFDAPQTSIWEGSGGLEDVKISELIDHIESRNGKNVVKRYLPVENHLPEKSFKQAGALHEQCSTRWNNHPPRPLHLLHPPEMINVVAPIPDYPPMMFTYKGKHHKIIKADGPERIEQEWWTARGRHRDYYAVEDEEGKRYWLFRSGHYDADKTYKWFLHGFFV
jgi:protein ImuB